MGEPDEWCLGCFQSDTSVDTLTYDRTGNRPDHPPDNDFSLDDPRFDIQFRFQWWRILISLFPLCKRYLQYMYAEKRWIHEQKRLLKKNGMKG
jgi:hypothetical protein